MKLNKKGFAITAIIYSILVIVIIIMTLVLAIMSSRRQTVEKIQERVKEETAKKQVPIVDPGPIDPGPPINYLYKTIINQTLSSETVDFSNPNQTGLFKEENGIYYYRGNVTNNYALFSGHCWRIVRTTKTQGVKMIYSGTFNDNKCQITKSDKYFTYDEIMQKIDKNDWTPIIPNAIPDYSLEDIDMCIKITSFFTMQRNASFENNNCESTLTSKIGLLTADEVIYAGGSTGRNNNYYLSIDQSGDSNYTMLTLTKTNAYFGMQQYINIINNGGLARSTSDSFIFRPVISLVPNTEYTEGDGTATNPYVIN